MNHENHLSHLLGTSNAPNFFKSPCPFLLVLANAPLLLFWYQTQTVDEDQSKSSGERKNPVAILQGAINICSHHMPYLSTTPAINHPCQQQASKFLCISSSPACHFPLLMMQSYPHAMRLEGQGPNNISIIYVDISRRIPREEFSLPHYICTIYCRGPQTGDHCALSTSFLFQVFSPVPMKCSSISKPIWCQGCSGQLCLLPGIPEGCTTGFPGRLYCPEYP